MFRHGDILLPYCCVWLLTEKLEKQLCDKQKGEKFKPCILFDTAVKFFDHLVLFNFCQNSYFGIIARMLYALTLPGPHFQSTAVLCCALRVSRSRLIKSKQRRLYKCHQSHGTQAVDYDHSTPSIRALFIAMFTEEKW